MKNINKIVIIRFGLIFFLSLNLFSCDESYLEEKPLDRFSPENILINKAGFEAALVAVYNYARKETTLDRPDQMNSGTDIGTSGVASGRYYSDYTLVLPEDQISNYVWDWAYSDMLKSCNMIITRAENPDIDWTEEEKNQILAVARFFRGYTHNVLVNLFGGVPIVDEESVEPRYDYVRASRLEVLEFVQQDLEFAEQWLPIVEEGTSNDGRIFKAAANHLLAEVYISLGREKNDVSFFDKSISAATKVIDGSNGDYQLMTERFGDLSRPGDVYSDLFWTGQQNRSSGNKEGIWLAQFEYSTIGGNEWGNTNLRWWGPKFESVKGADGKPALLLSDSIGRSQGGNRPTNLFNYEVWKDDWNDMRNSKYNIRRVWYNNNPDSEFFGKEFKTVKKDGKLYAANADGTASSVVVDTLRFYFPMLRKVEGLMPLGFRSGRTSNDVYRMRLAETYLLRAEAYIHKGDKEKAAIDINVVRARANAIPVSAANVDIHYLLDERARELSMEEQRRRTLIRLGLLYERTKKYNFRSTTTIQPYHELLPIPQKAIDANRDVKLEQNPGYPGSN